MSKGSHIIIDLTDLPAHICENDKVLAGLLISASETAGANIICSSRYRFGADSPPGCSVFLMLDESHISAHTYAEEGKIALDIFTCGSKVDAERILSDLLRDLKARNPKITRIKRF